MQTLVVIPARGGSKGIVGKNVAPLAGIPLLGYAPRAALEATRVQRVAGSTDDERIAAEARAHGAEVIRRPAAISGDTASSESALLHALDHLRDTEGYEPDLLVFVQCTSPLTAAVDIDGTIETLLDENADSALSVTPFHYFIWRQDGDGSGVGVNHDRSVRELRQEREPQYLETGGVYVMRVAGFRSAKHRFFGRTVLHVTPPERRLEIDEPVDLRIAEVLIRDQQEQERRQLLPQPVTALIMDFDGVFTDNMVTVDQDGREAVVCSRGDGLGVSLLRRLGLPMLVLSKETNPVVRARCQKLRIECLQGEDHKLATLQRWLEARNLDRAGAVYLGNDLNDLECMGWVGCPVAVADAVPEARSAARILLSRSGGRDAVRELTDMIRNQIGESDATNG